MYAIFKYLRCYLKTRHSVVQYKYQNFSLRQQIKDTYHECRSLRLQIKDMYHECRSYGGTEHTMNINFCLRYK